MVKYFRPRHEYTLRFVRNPLYQHSSCTLDHPTWWNTYTCSVSRRSIYYKGKSGFLWCVIFLSLLPPFSIKSVLYTVYNFLNPQTQHAVLAAWIIGIALAYCVIFSLVRGIVIVRVRVFARGVRGAFRQRAESGGMEGEKSEAEGVDDWVEVDSGRWNRRQR